MSEIALENSLRLMENGNYGEALSHLNFYLRQYPSNPDARCARGLCYLELGNAKKGKKDILAALDMGSAVAEEVLLSGKYKKFEIRVNVHKNIGGLLLFFCISCYITALISIIYYAKSGDIVQLINFIWCIVTGLLLQKRAPWSVLNVIIFLISHIIFNIMSAANNAPLAAGYAFWQVLWLIYFFVSKRVKETYGECQYEFVEFGDKMNSQGNTAPFVNATRSEHLSPMKTISNVVELINYKIIAVIISIVILAVSGVLIKRSFDMKTVVENRYDYVPAGNGNIFKIDKQTGKKWIVNSYGEHEVINRKW